MLIDVFYSFFFVASVRQLFSTVATLYRNFLSFALMGVSTGPWPGFRVWKNKIHF